MNLQHPSPGNGKEAIRAKYMHPDHQTSNNIIMSTYVDKVNTHHTPLGELKEIETNMRHDYNKWKELLQASRGKLALFQKQHLFHI
jgi:hypothetical protein